jgi:hypothetical protein
VIVFPRTLLRIDAVDTYSYLLQRRRLMSLKHRNCASLSQAYAAAIIQLALEFERCNCCTQVAVLQSHSATTRVSSARKEALVSAPISHILGWWWRLICSDHDHFSKQLLQYHVKPLNDPSLFAGGQSAVARASMR